MAISTQTITLHFLVDVNCYLIKTARGFFLIDSGFPRSRRALEKSLEASGCRPGDLSLILITHGDFDHTGSAAYLRRKYRLENEDLPKIAMHKGDSGMAEKADMFWNRKNPNQLVKILAPLVSGFTRSDRFTPDLYFEDGDDLGDYGLDARIVALPGHSQGSIGILTSRGDLFCGDLLTNDKSGPHPGLGDPADFTASIEKLDQYPIETIYPGHGKPFRLEELHQARDRR